MPWVGFEPTISAGVRLKTYALDRTATGTGYLVIVRVIYYLTQLYFARGYMFRLFIQPSSGQLTIEHNLFYVRSIWDPTVWDPILCAHKKVMFYCKLA